MSPVQKKGDKKGRYITINTLVNILRGWSFITCERGLPFCCGVIFKTWFGGSISDKGALSGGVAKCELKLSVTAAVNIIHTILYLTQLYVSIKYVVNFGAIWSDLFYCGLL